MSRFNVLSHKLVPEHYVVSEDDEKKILQQLRVSKEQLPKIWKSDPVIKVLEELYGEKIKEGQIIKIVSESLTSKKFVSYRVVVDV
jgi:DNA-directed RNA polymerase subunit H (RpoH/RPB5)